MAEQPSMRRSQSRPQQILNAFVSSHGRALFGALGRLYRTPLATLMTAAVLGIALALPTGFLLLLSNLQGATAGWSADARLSAFLRTDVSSERYRALAATLAQDPQVAATTLITPEQALEEFRAVSGMEDALALLDSNPLPAVVLVWPATGLAPDAAAALAERVRRLPEVELVQLDHAWIQRLAIMVDLARRTTLVIAAMLGIAVILVIGNTIRLAIENRRDELMIVKLLGATDAFIRRPFLYEGFWYGAAGGSLALLLIESALLLLRGPAVALTASYGSPLLIHGLGWSGAGLLLGSSTLLGLTGSWLAVGRHLRAIEPR
jgi:cell division transport system permease protein